MRSPCGVACDPDLARDVTIKVIHDGQLGRESPAREAGAASRPAPPEPGR